MQLRRAALTALRRHIAPTFPLGPNMPKSEGWRSVPLIPAAVAEWLTTMADEGKAMSTLQVARAALAAAHREAGLEDPTTSELVRRVLSGLAREAARMGKRPTQGERADRRRLTARPRPFQCSGNSPSHAGCCERHRFDPGDERRLVETRRKPPNWFGATSPAPLTGRGGW